MVNRRVLRRDEGEGEKIELVDDVVFPELPEPAGGVIREVLAVPGLPPSDSEAAKEQVQLALMPLPPRSPRCSPPGCARAQKQPAARYPRPGAFEVLAYDTRCARQCVLYSKYRTHALPERSEQVLEAMLPFLILVFGEASNEHMISVLVGFANARQIVVDISLEDLEARKGVVLLDDMREALHDVQAALSTNSVEKLENAIDAVPHGLRTPVVQEGESRLELLRTLESSIEDAFCKIKQGLVSSGVVSLRVAVSNAEDEGLQGEIMRDALQLLETVGDEDLEDDDEEETGKRSSYKKKREMSRKAMAVLSNIGGRKSLVSHSAHFEGAIGAIREMLAEADSVLPGESGDLAANLERVVRPQSSDGSDGQEALVGVVDSLREFTRRVSTYVGEQELQKKRASVSAEEMSAPATAAARAVAEHEAAAHARCLEELKEAREAEQEAREAKDNFSASEEEALRRLSQSVQSEAAAATALERSRAQYCEMAARAWAATACGRVLLWNQSGRIRQQSQELDHLRKNERQRAAEDKRRVVRVVTSTAYVGAATRLSARWMETRLAEARKAGEAEEEQLAAVAMAALDCAERECALRCEHAEQSAQEVTAVRDELQQAEMEIEELHQTITAQKAAISDFADSQRMSALNFDTERRSTLQLRKLLGDAQKELRDVHVDKQKIEETQELERSKSKTLEQVAAEERKSVQEESENLHRRLLDAEGKIATLEANHKNQEAKALADALADVERSTTEIREQAEAAGVLRKQLAQAQDLIHELQTAAPLETKRQSYALAAALEQSERRGNEMRDQERVTMALKNSLIEAEVRAAEQEAEAERRQREAVDQAVASARAREAADVPRPGGPRRSWPLLPSSSDGAAGERDALRVEIEAMRSEGSVQLSLLEEAAVAWLDCEMRADEQLQQQEQEMRSHSDSIQKELLRARDELGQARDETAESKQEAEQMMKLMESTESRLREVTERHDEAQAQLVRKDAAWTAEQAVAAKVPADTAGLPPRSRSANDHYAAAGGGADAQSDPEPKRHTWPQPSEEVERKTIKAELAELRGQDETHKTLLEQATAAWVDCEIRTDHERVQQEEVTISLEDRLLGLEMELAEVQKSQNCLEAPRISVSRQSGAGAEAAIARALRQELSQVQAEMSEFLASSEAGAQQAPRHSVADFALAKALRHELDDAQEEMSALRRVSAQQEATLAAQAAAPAPSAAAAEEEAALAQALRSEIAEEQAALSELLRAKEAGAAEAKAAETDAERTQAVAQAAREDASREAAVAEAALSELRHAAETHKVATEEARAASAAEAAREAAAGEAAEAQAALAELRQANEAREAKAAASFKEEVAEVWAAARAELRQWQDEARAAKAAATEVRNRAAATDYDDLVIDEDEVLPVHELERERELAHSPTPPSMVAESSRAHSAMDNLCTLLSTEYSGHFQHPDASDPCSVARPSNPSPRDPPLFGQRPLALPRPQSGGRQRPLSASSTGSYTARWLPGHGRNTHRPHSAPLSLMDDDLSSEFSSVGPGSHTPTLMDRLSRRVAPGAQLLAEDAPHLPPAHGGRSPIASAVGGGMPGRAMLFGSPSSMSLASPPASPRKVASPGGRSPASPLAAAAAAGEELEAPKTPERPFSPSAAAAAGGSEGSPAAAGAAVPPPSAPEAAETGAPEDAAPQPTQEDAPVSPGRATMARRVSETAVEELFQGLDAFMQRSI
eukprot:TRINITY_DN4154_c0_g1_i3.p1 TRINITY_DN4154_c0_g1~~TRINITY_DN4154_c0_g1_i3.p1  ORF type:complete len:1846 (+),score=517.65 TRINITY_DN4154_c0_g1_i3:403-5538(+)